MAIAEQNLRRVSMNCHRRLTVDCGRVCCLPQLSNRSYERRHWISSSVEVICEGFLFSGGSLKSISFESNSKLTRIERRAFRASALTSIHLPAAVEVICESCFSVCRSLISISFELNSKLSRIERDAFRGSGLTSIHLPASVEMIGQLCFSECRSLISISFEANSKLSRIEDGAFRWSGLTSIRLPASIELISESCFSECRSLQSISADPTSPLHKSKFSREFRARFPMAFADRTGGADSGVAADTGLSTEEPKEEGF
jgi:hypothetical protein